MCSLTCISTIQLRKSKALIPKESLDRAVALHDARAAEGRSVLRSGAGAVALAAARSPEVVPRLMLVALMILPCVCRSRGSSCRRVYKILMSSTQNHCCCIAHLMVLRRSRLGARRTTQIWRPWRCGIIWDSLNTLMHSPALPVQVSEDCGQIGFNLSDCSPGAGASLFLSVALCAVCAGSE